MKAFIVEVTLRNGELSYVKNFDLYFNPQSLTTSRDLAVKFTKELRQKVEARMKLESASGREVASFRITEV